jgi:1-phosphofructokinase/tagatose 6-phosphate kinase
MIITVTLNAALDKTLEVPNFTPGRRHRTVDQTTMPGGKGVNIARTVKRLGQPVIATGLAGGSTGTRIIDALTDESILNAFVRIREESRTNTAVVDPTTGVHTEVNERGPEVSPQELELFRDKLLYLAQGASMCVFAGSLPRGVEPDVYGELIREVHKLGVTTVLDTDGEPLRLGVRAEPDIVSPNELEAEELVGHEFNDDDDRAESVVEITRLGAREAIMTVADGPGGWIPRVAAPARRGARAALDDRDGRRFPGRLRLGPLYGAPAGRCAAVRGGVWRRIHPAFRRRRARSGPGRAHAFRGSGGAARAEGRNRLRPTAALPVTRVRRPG